MQDREQDSGKPGAGTLKKALLLGLKLTISGGLLYFVLSRAGFDRVMESIAGSNPLYFLLAVALYMLIFLCGALRWQTLMHERHPLSVLFPLYTIGGFFNVFLPGLVGGDAVKVYYLYKRTGRGSDALASVFMDRYIGYSALMVVGLTAYPFGYKYLKTMSLEYLIPAMLAAFLIASYIVFGLRLGGRFGVLSRMYEYFAEYRGKKTVLLRALLYGIVIQSVSVLMVISLSWGLGLHMPLSSYFVFVPIISTLSAIPLSVSGLGIREAAFVMLFGSLGMPPEEATALSFLWFISTAVAGLVGLVEYLRARGNAEKEPKGPDT